MSAELSGPPLEEEVESSWDGWDEADGSDAPEEPAEALGMTDHQAYRLIRDGEAAGIAHLYAAYADQLRAIAGQRFPNLEAADIVQNAFRNILARRQETEELQAASAFGYLVRVTVNAAFDELRRQAARPPIRTAGDTRQMEAALPSTADTSEEAMDRLDAAKAARLLEQIPKVLPLLSPDQRAVVTARLDGLNHQQIADRCGIKSIGTVKSHLSRGLAKLRQLAEAASVADLPGPARQAGEPDRKAVPRARKAS